MDCPARDAHEAGVKEGKEAWEKLTRGGKEAISAHASDYLFMNFFIEREEAGLKEVLLFVAHTRTPSRRLHAGISTFHTKKIESLHFLGTECEERPTHPSRGWFGAFLI